MLHHLHLNLITWQIECYLTLVKRYIPTGDAEDEGAVVEGADVDVDRDDGSEMTMDLKPFLQEEGGKAGAGVQEEAEEEEVVDNQLLNTRLMFSMQVNRLDKCPTTHTPRTRQAPCKWSQMSS